MNSVSQYCDEEELRRALPLNTQTKTAELADIITEVSSGFDALLTFSYGGPARIVILSSDGDTRLMLPVPGAGDHGVTEIIENGLILSPALYEVEPLYGRYVLRLTSDGRTGLWTAGDRHITVTFAPTAAPASVRSRAKIECVRMFRSRQMGHARVIGAAGVSQLAYPEGFEDATIELLDRLRHQAGSGGPGWVTF